MNGQGDRKGTPVPYDEMRNHERTGRPQGYARTIREVNRRMVRAYPCGRPGNALILCYNVVQPARLTVLSPAFVVATAVGLPPLSEPTRIDCVWLVELISCKA